MKTSLERWDDLRGIQSFLNGSSNESYSSKEQGTHYVLNEVDAIRTWLIKAEDTAYGFSVDSMLPSGTIVTPTQPLRIKRSKRLEKSKALDDAMDEDPESTISEEDELDEELFVTWNMISRKKDRTEPLPFAMARRQMRKSAKFLDILAERVEQNEEDKHASLRLHAKGLITVTNLEDLRSLFMEAGMRRQYDHLLEEYIGRIEDAFPGTTPSQLEQMNTKRLSRVVSMYIPDPRSRRNNRAVTFRFNIDSQSVADYFGGSDDRSVFIDGYEDPTLDKPVFEGYYDSTSQQVTDEYNALEVTGQVQPINNEDQNSEVIFYDGENDELEGIVVAPIARSPFSSLIGKKIGLAKWYELSKDQQDEIEILEEWERWLLGHVFTENYYSKAEDLKYDVVHRTRLELNNVWLTRSDAERFAVHAIIDRLSSAE
jgi:hypothetical protein